MTHAPSQVSVAVDRGEHLLIMGDSGTGKSSILAAIIACLGGNPNKHSSIAGGAIPIDANSMGDPYFGDLSLIHI